VNVKVDPGKYILAVSGGVDSMVLLDLLSKKPGIELVVAHFNHGIRPEAGEDEEFVRRRASVLSLPFEDGHGYLGGSASEETARNARYKFLYAVQDQHKTDGIITAHHEDDLVETAFLNLLRGSGRKGVIAISQSNIVRPLLGVTKNEIINYARSNNIEWREDSTNTQTMYLRNSVRKQLTIKLTEEKRQEILNNIDKVAKIDREVDYQIANLSRSICQNGIVNRASFTSLPINLGSELVTYWLKQNGISDYDSNTVGRINIALRTFKPGTDCVIKHGVKLEIAKKTAHFRASV
jgi:tRNA(Ile)-lysidine synthase